MLINRLFVNRGQLVSGRFTYNDSYNDNNKDELCFDDLITNDSSYNVTVNEVLLLYSRYTCSINNIMLM